MTQLPLHLSELTYPQAAELEGAVGLLPAGATEAHGPHLPLNTDAVIAEAVAEQAVGAVNDIPVYLLPVMAVGGVITLVSATVGLLHDGRRAKAA